MEIVTAKYKAKTESTGSRVEIDAELPVEINKMVVWILTNIDVADGLLPVYNKLREAFAGDAPEFT